MKSLDLNIQFAAYSVGCATPEEFAEMSEEMILAHPIEMHIFEMLFGATLQSINRNIDYAFGEICDGVMLVSGALPSEIGR